MNLLMHRQCRPRGGPAWPTTACLGLVAAAAASLALGTRERHHSAVAQGAATPLCNGSQLWSFATGDGVTSLAVGADGTVYVGSYDHKLYALTPEGQLKWSFATGGQVDSSPVVGVDDTVYVGSWDNKLYAVTPLCGCARAELRLCGATRTDSWTCLACVAAHDAPLKSAGCSSANASDFCSHLFTPCVLAEDRLCGPTTNSSADCFLCCGEHEQVLRQVRSPPHSWSVAPF